MFGNDTLTPEMLMALGGGIMQGSNLGTGLGTGLQNASTVMAAQKQKAEVKAVENKTREWLKTQFPGENFDTATPDMMRLYATQAFKQRFDKPSLPAVAEEYNFAKDQGFTGSFMDYQKSKAGLDSKPPAEYQNYQMMQNDPGYAEWAKQQQSTKDTPPIAKEYEWAKQEGFKGTPQEYQAWKANLSKQKGMKVSYDTVNGFQMTQGDVETAPPKLTEAQSKDLNFLTRAKKAEEDLTPVEEELTSFSQKVANGLPMDVGNYTASPNYQKAQQAGREILAIILRKDSGAAITKEEQDIYGKIYLPQPGDDKATIAAKKQSRETAIKAIQAGLGPLAPGDETSKTSKTTQPIPAEDYFKEP